MEEFRVHRETGAVPVQFCRRQKKWLPIEEHLKCEFCVAPVFDEHDDPVSFLCVYDEEKKKFQEEERREQETGAGD